LSDFAAVEPFDQDQFGEAELGEDRRDLIDEAEDGG
jgi:hypothetical protein